VTLEELKMAVKARSRKQQNILNLINDSKKIACRHCVLYGNCNTQKQKEKSEEMGITTYCSLTPNKEMSKKGKSKKKKQ
jgi:hypothetical protein